MNAAEEKFARRLARDVRILKRRGQWSSVEDYLARVRRRELRQELEKLELPAPSKFCDFIGDGNRWTMAKRRAH